MGPEPALVDVDAPRGSIAGKPRQAAIAAERAGQVRAGNARATATGRALVEVCAGHAVTGVSRRTRATREASDRIGTIDERAASAVVLQALVDISTLLTVAGITQRALTTRVATGTIRAAHARITAAVVRALRALVDV
jgi:hypothetical protein